MEKKWTYRAVYSIIQIHFVRGKASSCTFLSKQPRQGAREASCSLKRPVTAAEHKGRSFRRFSVMYLSSSCRGAVRPYKGLLRNNKSKKRMGGLCHCSETFFTHFLPKGISGVTGKFHSLKRKCSLNGS